MDLTIMETVRAFDEEHMELLKWRFARLDESSKLSYESKGLDGSPRGMQERKDAAEYRRRLRELEAKYGIAQAS